MLGIAALELAVQASFVAHQTQVLSLDPGARNRLLTWLVLSAYLGAALLLSALLGQLQLAWRYGHGSWPHAGGPAAWVWPADGRWRG